MMPAPLICLSLAAIFALIYLLRHAGGPQSRAKSVSKTAAVVALVPMAGLAGAPLPILAGLALGAVGDFALSRDGQRAFLVGMAAFAAGHLAYLWAFLDLGAMPSGWTIALIALGLSTEFWLLPRTGGLCWPVRGYIWIIVAMAAAAMGLPGGLWPVIAGSAAFVASDMILALELFVLRDARAKLFASRALWVLYWGGQALIGWGAGASMAAG
ncbi:MAG: lysoplasmalogenase [Rhodobacteraceae bacterium]|nr:MAG: lysoplasmalogenase [Paracoccaceae bacterium]